MAKQITRRRVCGVGDHRNARSCRGCHTIYSYRFYFRVLRAAFPQGDICLSSSFPFRNQGVKGKNRQQYLRRDAREDRKHICSDAARTCPRRQRTHGTFPSLHNRGQVFMHAKASRREGGGGSCHGNISLFHACACTMGLNKRRHAQGQSRNSNAPSLPNKPGP